MVEFTLLGFPVRIRPWFWVLCFMLGGGFRMGQAADWVPVFEWMLVALISILIHELGHAQAVRYYGGQAAIELHTFGGTTYMRGCHQGRLQSIFISLAGPGCSIALALISFVAWKRLPAGVPLFGEIFETSFILNCYWTVFNLLPVMPMDGGQVMRDALGPARFRTACLISGVTAVLMAILLAAGGAYLAAAFLAVLAWQNFKGSIHAGGVSR